jgi:hypothetical protein
MATIAVYKYLLQDAATQQWRKQPGYGTREFIERLRGAMIFGTKIEVDEAQVRDGQYFIRIATASG